MSTNPQSSTINSRKSALDVGAVLIAVLAAYLNALRNGFVLDDVLIVQQNPIIRDWHNIPELFTVGYWTQAGIDPHGLYRPVTMLTYLLEYQAFGLDPAYYHLDNILLHFLCCALVYFIVERISRNRIAGLVSAILFAVHPVHVEAVSSVVGRAELLAVLFTLAGFHAYISTPKRVPWYVVSPAFMLLGLLSKETAVVLPVLILAHMLIFEREGRGKGLKSAAVSLAPYAVAVGIVFLARFFVLSGGITPDRVPQVLTAGAYTRFLLMTRAFVQYIRLGLIPTDLRSYYMFAPPGSLFNVWTLSFALVIAALAAASPRLIRDRREYYLFALWFFIGLIPVSQVVPIGMLMSERAMYLPSVSLCAIGGMLFTSALGAPGSDRGVRASAAAMLAVAVLCLGVMTYQRNPVWRDSDSIENSLTVPYNHAIAELPDSAYQRYLAAASFERLKMYKDALLMMQDAVRLSPSTAEYRIVLGNVLMEAGERGKAVAEYARGLELGPSDTGMTQYLSIAAFNLRKLGLYGEAVRMIDTAIGLTPDDASFYVVKGNILLEAGDDDAALAMFTKAAGLDAYNQDAYLGIGIVSDARGDTGKAVASIRKAVELAPGSPDLHYFLANAYIRAGRREEAVAELQTALSLKPDYPGAAALLDSLDNNP